MGDAGERSDEARRAGHRALAATLVLGGVVTALAGCIDAGPEQGRTLPSAQAPTSTAPPSTGADAPAGADAACTVDYQVTNEWPDGFGGRVTVTNHGAAREDWVLAWHFDAGQQITESWEATLDQDGADVTATAPQWATTLASDASASFGFNASWKGKNPAPTQFTLDGDACALAGDESASPGTTGSADDTAAGAASDDAFYLVPDTQAHAAAAAASGEDRALLTKIASTPQAVWIGDWTDSATARARVAELTQAADDDGTTATLVVYAIPGRDCGQHSAGGVATSEYASFVDAVADGVVGEPLVVLEPDALAQLGDCDGQGDRVGYLAYAANALDEAGARVYLDAGHAHWLSAAEAARRIEEVGTEHLAGFALNTSNYDDTASERAYGEDVSKRAGGLGYVIDTSRNGNGSNGEWCNPRGRALGERPTTVDDGTALDALLWVKAPGESDGACNGGPAAGQWWQDVALELAENADW